MLSVVLAAIVASFGSIRETVRDTVALFNKRSFLANHGANGNLTEKLFADGIARFLATLFRQQSKRIREAIVRMNVGTLVKIT